MIRVLLVDDHQLVRRGLAQLIHDTPGMDVAGEAGDGQGALDVLRSTQPDVVVLDLSMPGRGGLDVLQELRAQSPGSRIIILTMYPEEQYAIRTFREGAAAYLTKASAPEELIQAIRTVAAGKRYITPSVADRLATCTSTALETVLTETRYYDSSGLWTAQSVCTGNGGSWTEDPT